METLVSTPPPPSPSPSPSLSHGQCTTCSSVRYGWCSVRMVPVVVVEVLMLRPTPYMPCPHKPIKKTFSGIPHPHHVI